MEMKKSHPNAYKESFSRYNAPSTGALGPQVVLFDNLIWLTTEEAAEFLRKSCHALRQMLYKGKISARKFHGRLYFKKSELHELIDTSFY